MAETAASASRCHTDSTAENRPMRLSEGCTLTPCVNVSAVNKSHTTACEKCSVAFGLFSKKKVCRGCCKICCDSCTNKRFSNAAIFGRDGMQRVCGDCYFLLVEYRFQTSEQKKELPNYAVINNELLQQVTDLLTVPKEKWYRICHEKGVDVFGIKLKQSALVCVKTILVVKAPPRKVYDIYCTNALWKNWEKDLIEHRVIEKLNDMSEVVYISYKLPVVNNRDVCVYSVYLDGLLLDPMQPGSFTILAKSVDHPLCPEANTCVRAIINMSCTEFEQINGGAHTRITTYVHTDPRGLLPPFIVNKMMSTIAGSQAAMAEFMEKRHKEGL